MKVNYPNKRIAMAAIIAFIVVCCFMVAQWVIGDREGTRKNLNIEFAGRVERIEYNIKQFPTITVGDSTYHIGSGYDTDHQIEIGDSVIKRKGSEVYKLIKQKTYKIIEFTK